jgi:hypothetical protein
MVTTARGLSAMPRRAGYREVSTTQRAAEVRSGFCYTRAAAAATG